MPVHDWTRVEAGTFHDFHNGWVIHIKEALNDGLLPAGYYAQSEQHAGAYIADVLTLRQPAPPVLPAPKGAGLALAEAPPKVTTRLVGAGYALRRRTVTVRHVSGHQVVALIEIASPANKDRTESVHEFTDKALDALRHGVHLLVIDLFPPGRHDPRGLTGDIWRRWAARRRTAPADRPLTLAAFVARRTPEAYVEHLAVGAALPDMPLFLSPDHYIYAPLQSTYDAAYRGVPEFWREVVEGRRTAEG